MKTKLILSAIIVLLSINCLQAQENEESSNQLFQLPENSSRWDFGLTFQALSGIRQIQHNAGSEKTDEAWIGLGVGLYADYKINKVWSLRAEAGVNTPVAIQPYVNFQSEFKFSKRWSFYAGAGAYFNTNADSLVNRDSRGQVILNPYVQLGLRYKMSKSWTMDLRYQQDLFARQRATNFNRFSKEGEMSTFSLGFNYRF